MRQFSFLITIISIKGLLYLLSLIIVLIACKKESAGSFLPTNEKPVAVAIGSSLLQHRERPFKGRIVGNFASTPTSHPAIYNSVANAGGTVTHLGVFNKITSDVINLDLSTVEGTFIMTSQSGEQIKGRYNGTFSFGIIPGTFSWDLNATITGGTGRFSRATGEFVFLATGDYVIEEGVVKGNYTETFEGTIIY